MQYAVIFDRIFRFAITGTRVRNYDGLGGQLLFAWLHQHHVLHWTDTPLAIDWDERAGRGGRARRRRSTSSTGARSTGRRSRTGSPPTSWCAATLTPHPASVWAGAAGRRARRPAEGLHRPVLDDEFPLSMFYEALEKKMSPVIESTVGIRANRIRRSTNARRLAEHRRVVLIAGATSAAGRGRPRPARGRRPGDRRRPRPSSSTRSRRTCPGVRAEVCDLTDERDVRELAERVHAARRHGRRGRCTSSAAGAAAAGSPGRPRRTTACLERSFTALRVRQPGVRRRPAGVARRTPRDRVVDGGRAPARRRRELRRGQGRERGVDARRRAGLREGGAGCR